MKTDTKEEFRQLLKASGWSQAEASRQLRMTPSALSQIVRRNSPVHPSAVSLRLFKLLVWHEKPDALQASIMHEDMPGLSQTERQMIRKLRQHSPKEQRKFLRTFVNLLDLAGPPKRKKGK